MSAVLEIIDQAKSAGIKLTMEDGQLTAAGPQEAVDRLLPILRAHKPELLAALSETRLDPAEVSGHWLILQAPQRLERWFTPPVTRAELERRYPNAALVCLPDTAAAPGETPNAGEPEAAELGCLVALVARAEGFTQDETQEALAGALADPEHALVSFRALAAEVGIASAPAAGMVRLWLTLREQDGAETQAAIDIPSGRYDGVRVLELFEKHLAAGTTRVRRVTDQPGAIEEKQ